MALREARNEQATGGCGVLFSKGLRRTNERPMAKGEIERIRKLGCDNGIGLSVFSEVSSTELDSKRQSTPVLSRL